MRQLGRSHGARKRLAVHLTAWGPKRSLGRSILVASRRRPDVVHAGPRAFKSRTAAAWLHGERSALLLALGVSSALQIEEAPRLLQGGSCRYREGLLTGLAMRVGALGHRPWGSIKHDALQIMPPPRRVDLSPPTRTRQKNPFTFAPRQLRSRTGKRLGRRFGGIGLGG